MLSLNPWDILWTIVNLLVLYAIFRKFLFQPVMNVIHEREEMINKQFEDAQKQHAVFHPPRRQEIKSQRRRQEVKQERNTGKQHYALIGSSARTTASA